MTRFTGVGKSTLLEQALAGVQSNRDLPLQRKRTEKATHFTFSFGWPGDAVELAVIDTVSMQKLQWHAVGGLFTDWWPWVSEP